MVGVRLRASSSRGGIFFWDENIELGLLDRAFEEGILFNEAI